MKVFTKNKYAFSLGTIGRDMSYSLVSMYLIFYLTDILQLPDQIMWWITGIFFIARIFDAINDPIMGTIVDNTNTRFGKFKPWIGIGALFSGIVTIFMFTDFGLTGAAYVSLFAVLYILWDVFFTMNDIAFWSMMPTLTTDQKQREKIGALARIFANVGLFTVVAGIVPITNALGNSFGSMKTGYFVFSIIIASILWIGQCITLWGVKEDYSAFKVEEKTKLKDMFNVIFKNDQLLYTAVAMVLFMIGYTTTTSFGLYFFKYAYKDENMYGIFALILGVSQILALLIFPFFSKYFTRKQLYSGATALVVLGYVIFFFSPMNMAFIGTSGIFLFVGQAFIQLLMLMFLTDTIEYGQWKFGKRNNSITLSLQPFINKMGAAVGTGIVNVTIILSGINAAVKPSDVTESGLLMMKFSMLVLPIFFIVGGFLVYNFKYKIDKEMYEKILIDLKQRGDLDSDELKALNEMK